MVSLRNLFCCSQAAGSGDGRCCCKVTPVFSSRSHPIEYVPTVSLGQGWRNRPLVTLNSNNFVVPTPVDPKAGRWIESGALVSYGF